MATFIDTEGDLEERLSRPSPADVAAAAALDGDVLILGVGGKMGPTLACLIQRAFEAASVRRHVIGVSRFTDARARSTLEAAGVETIACDLLDMEALAGLPDAPNIIFMAARKFGTTGSEHLTWAMNTYLPGLVAERYRRSNIVAFSTGNVYPLRKVVHGGALESDAVDARGEYAQSAVGRERLFEYGSQRWNTPVLILRLNYAIDLRYGVLSDIGRAVFERRPIDLHMGAVNVIWQGDANSACLRGLHYVQSPLRILNLSGPETLSVRYLAQAFGKRFGLEPVLSGEEAESALLTNAGEAHRLFGYPSVPANELIDWTAHWIKIGGRSLNKATRFEVRDGAF